MSKIIISIAHENALSARIVYGQNVFYDLEPVSYKQYATNSKNEADQLKDALLEYGIPLSNIHIEEIPDEDQIEEFNINI